MKQYLTLLCILLCTSLKAQVAKLENLSRGKFYSSAEIKDGGNNVKGYFLLYESDKIAKETYQLEYVLLDENLARVTGGFITEDKYEGTSFKVKSINVEASLCRNKLLLEFSDDFETTLAYKRYRILDITSFEMSEPFMAKDGKLVFNPVFDKGMRDDYDKQSDPVMFFKDVGLVTFSPYITKKSVDREKYITHFDDNFTPVWRYTFDSNINPDEKDLKQKDMRYIGSDGELIVLLVHGIRNNGKFKPEYMIHFVDSHDGKLIKEVFFPDTEKVAYEVTKCVLSNDSISFTGLYAVGPQWYAHKAGFINEGMFNHTYSRKTLSITERKEITWKQSIGNRFALDKRNGIKGQGYLYAHDFLPLSNGGMIGILEAYELSPVGTNNMYFFELSPDFSLKEVYEAAKPGNRFPEAFSQGTDPKKYGLLDFVDYQNLGNDEFVFFFIDNAKKTKNRKNSSLFGIVSYSDGKFSRQAINLETPGSSIQAINAKKGYILVQESFKDKKKQAEMRLEKINY